MAGLETSAEIAKKLQEYEAQLKELEMIAAMDPNDKEMKALKDNLLKVTQRFAQLYEQKKAEEAAAAEAAKTAAAAPQGGNAGTTGAGAGAGAGVDVADYSALPLGPVVEWSNGDRVEAFYNNGLQRYPGVVEAIGADGMLTIRMIATGKTDKLTPDRLRALKWSKRRVPSKDVVTGLVCQAKYSDGKWYNCKVGELGHSTTKVTFTQYGNTETVPPEYLRLLPESEVALQQEQAAKQAEDMAGVPDHLIPLPTDSVEEVEKKRKKIKAIKSKRRFKRLEAERDAKKNSWKAFSQKTKRSKRTGFMTNMKKKSIFATPEGNTGKVGVTGSGRGMTDFQKRKKVRLAQRDGAAAAAPAEQVHK